MTEFLTRVHIQPPEELNQQALERLRSAESHVAAHLASRGHLLRLWRPVDTVGWSNIGLWSASSEESLLSAMKTLPLFPYMTVSLEELRQHPNDPAQPPDSDPAADRSG